MAIATHTGEHHAQRTPFYVPIIAALRAVAKSFGTAVLLSQESRARTTRRETLMAMSDAQLAEFGITRDQINAYVFPELLDR